MSASPDPAVISSRPVPTGTVTFAFTDIEGSTVRWERDRAAMEDAVRRHDALMRAAIAKHGGHVFKTIGDAFCTAFSRPEDAVVAMLAAQRALTAEDFAAVYGLRVRAAVHTGTADERDGDYFGPAVNRVARLLAIGHGGQVLVSGVSADLVQGALPPQASLRDLGEHRLKDLARPEHVYQLLAPDLAADFEPLRSLGALPNNLPRMLTSFVGREREIAEITALVERHRLVTLVGSGGVGKTRTSLQVGANLLDGSADGVWFIELAPLGDAALVPATIASALGVSLGSGEPLTSLVTALRSKRCLLLLDNCEHLVEAAAQTVSAIVHGCPSVAILASSRQGLGVAGEQAYRLPSLAIPGEQDATSLTALEALAHSAVALFVERARAADKRFELTDETAPIVADICRRLDGIALAIELAAARVSILRPAELRARLDQRFRVLTGGSRDVLPRQQTLRALIDWSYDLLAERERRLFRRLGIFVDGFTLQGAAAVGSDDELDEFETFDVVASLVDKSLVGAEFDAEKTRYRLLESTRAYAREKLREAGEYERIAERHLHYIRDLFVRVADAYESWPANADVLALRVELDDARAALDWAMVNGHARLGAEFFVSTTLWRLVGAFREAFNIAERVAHLLEGTPTPILARVWSVASGHAYALGLRDAAMQASRRALAVARECGDEAVLAGILRTAVIFLLREHGIAEAEAALQEAESLCSPTARSQLAVAERRALLAEYRGDPELAIGLWEDYRRLNASYGNLAPLASHRVAVIAMKQQNLPLAISYCRQLLDEGSNELFATALSNLLGLLLATDAFDEARRTGAQLLSLMRRTNPDGIASAVAIEYLALAAAVSGEMQRAGRLEGYAGACFRAAGYVRDFLDSMTYERLDAILRANLAARDLESLLSEGSRWTSDEALAEADRVVLPERLDDAS